jgi:hypothetical protein
LLVLKQKDKRKKEKLSSPPKKKYLKRKITSENSSIELRVHDN